jgi:hypothetical protein
MPLSITRRVAYDRASFLLEGKYIIDSIAHHERTVVESVIWWGLGEAVHLLVRV